MVYNAYTYERMKKVMIKNDTEMPLLLFRYRECTPYNLKALKDGFINGTLYKRFENAGELNLGITDSLMAKKGMTDEQRNKLVIKMVNHCKNNYYLASFTKNKVSYSSPEWKEYAKNHGYCLIYLFDTIYKEVIKSISHEKMVQILKVNYSDDPYLVDLFIETLFEKAETFELKEENDAENWIYDNKLGDHVVNAFAHKSKKYKRFNEFRLVHIKNNSDQNKDFLNHLLPAKPIAIVVRDDLNILCRHELQKIAEDRGISFRIISKNSDKKILK